MTSRLEAGCLVKVAATTFQTKLTSLQKVLFDSLQQTNNKQHIKQLRFNFNESICILAALTLLLLVPATFAVDCFKCSSRNGSNPACEDPFHNLNTTRVTTPQLPDPQPPVVYHTPCYAGKKGRQGLFPASACIKLTGKFDTTGETLVVRHCALDSGTLTQDTEIARMSHCGKFHFEGDYLKGCVLACPEDACNGISSTYVALSKFKVLAFSVAFSALSARLISSTVNCFESS